MTDNELIERFENLTLEPEFFHHREHVRLAWLYLKKHPPELALSKFCKGLKGFAAYHGKPDRYHETITWAFLVLIRQRMACNQTNDSWEEFAAVNGDLLNWKTKILSRYYTEETLQSELARKVFVFPDKIKEREIGD